MPPFRRLVLFAAAVSSAVAFTACEDIVSGLVDSIDGSFDAEACCHFEFWRDDTLLVRTVVLPAEDNTDEDTEYCVIADWDFENSDSWLKYELADDELSCSDDFKAEIYTGSNEYFEVVGTKVEPSHDAEGWWKLHIIRGDIDDIVDGGDFVFRFEPVDNCD